MREDTDPHIIGITESWATTDISDVKIMNDRICNV